MTGKWDHMYGDGYQCECGDAHVDTCQGCVATYPDDMGDVTTATYMTPAQITTNVIVPGVEVAVTVAYPNGESWGGVLRNSKAPRHGRYPASGGQLWCPACEAPVEECREADEIRRRLAALEGRVDE